MTSNPRHSNFDEIPALKAQIRARDEEIARLQEENRKLNDSKMAVVHCMQERGYKITELEGENQKLRSEIVVKNDRIADLIIINSKLTACGRVDNRVVGDD